MPSLQSRAALVSIQVINPSTGSTVGGTARVDSGADITLVDSAVLQQIGAAWTGQMRIQGVDGSPVTMYTYKVSVNLAQHGYLSDVTVVGDPGLANRDGYQMLVGTDLLATGVFDDSGLNNSFTLQLGIGTGPPIPTTPGWLLPAGIGGVVLGLTGLVLFMNR